MPTLDPALLRRPRTPCGERGAAAIEFVIVAPVVVLIFLLALQWTVRMQAERALQAAAREGAVAVARYQGTEADGTTATTMYLDRLDPSVSNRSVRAARSSTTARVTVSGDVLSLFPGANIRISAVAEVPVERFVQ